MVLMLTIDEKLARQLIIEQFPHWKHLLVRPVEFGGWDNRTFQLGQDMSIRLPSAEWYADQVEKEQYWLPILAPLLPLPIPTPLAMGRPSQNYPWRWSVYRWLDGHHATTENVANLEELAIALGRFLVEFQKIDSTAGPPPGKHNFFRGGSLAVYDAETRNSLLALRNEIDTGVATEIWETALCAKWQAQPVWVHGDVAASNLLVCDGRLSAVIDFGCLGIGDPACDLTIAWTFFSGASREAFSATLALDEETWARARGWALWKALITLEKQLATTSQPANQARKVINAVFEDYAHRK